MYEVSLETYLVQIIPQFLIIFSIQSLVIYGRLKWWHLSIVSILATIFSVFFLLPGLVIFGLLYGIYIAIFRNRNAVVSFVLLWETFLVFLNFVFLFTGMMRYWLPQTFDIPTFIFAGLINAIIIIVLIYISRKFPDRVQRAIRLLDTESALRNVFILYSTIICLSLYLFEFIFERLNVDFKIESLLLVIFCFLIIVNLSALYFLARVLMLDVDNKLLRDSEQAKQQYYADLELQQTHTRKILHDYKNVLAALQLFLDNDAPAEATMQTRQVIESAQATLNDIQPNNSALSMITTLPLRSLLYLKWTEASNKGVRLNIQSDGTVTISNNSDLLDVLRVVGILVDNAVEDAAGGEEADVLLTQSASELAITVVNTVRANFTLANLSQSGYTTKGEGHGNGLDNLRNVLRHNAHLKLMKRVTGMKLFITLVIEVA